MPDAPSPRAEVLRTRDFIGWEVRDPQGEKVGTVHDLLLDRGGTVRFLDVDLGLFRRHVLLPVSRVEWGEQAMVSRWGRDQLKRLPEYDADLPLTAEVLEEMGRAHPRFYGEEELPPPGETGIVPLGEAKDFRLPKEAPELRGWSVYGADKERVGEVSGVLVDPSAMKVRYLDVDVADDLFLLREDRHVLVPLEAVELQERSRDAWVRDLRAREVARLPAYTGGEMDPLVEERVRAAFGGG